MADTVISTHSLFDDDSVEEVTDEERTSLDNLDEEGTSDDLLAALQKVEVNAEELSKQEAELYLEAGDYFFLRGHSVTVSVIAKDKSAKDILSNGRTMINVSGQVQHNATGKKGMFRFTFSPDLRYQKDKDGNVKEPPTYDMFFQTYLKVTSFYFKKYESKPKNQADLVNMVKKGSFLMYISRGKQGGNFLGQFKEM